ncbi:MAG TPA: ATP-binding protein [Kiritimatiellia bacterium]|nr:ATP-binding protein [Kiritimatiellia bacterium]HRZ12630.1 ATP-binding protein [Kiritimatiellia bacterium]HSA17708.1 ATP-binding protein [Kiritimatiellia bacterium]
MSALRFTRSIRWRMLLWLAILLGLALAGLGVTAYQLQRLHRLRDIDQQLERRMALLSLDLRRRGPPPPGPDSERPPPPDKGPPPGRERHRGPPGPWTFGLSDQTKALFDETDPEGFYFATWSRDGAPLRCSSNAPPGIVRPAWTGDDPRIRHRTRTALREAYYFTERGDGVLAGLPIQSELKTLRRFAGWLILAGGVVLGLGIGGGWLLVGRALRPLRRIGETAGRISSGNLAERIDLAGTESELGRLASVLNAAFARLEASFAQQKQFTADAAHELRTPVAVILSEAQATLARERTPGEYRAALETCQNTARQMRRLIQSLLSLARFDAGQVRLERAPCDLAQLAQTGADFVRPLAEIKGIGITCDFTSAPAVGDADRLVQMLVNILTNAVDYSRPGGEIRISTRPDSNAASLSVSDTGEGIPEEDQPHLFERFYRGDKARADTGSHAGLGLAICKAIADAHGGRIEISSRPGAGTTVTMRIPS